MTTEALPQRTPLDVHPDLYAATVKATGYDPFNRQFVSTPRDPKTGRFVKAGAR